MATPHAAIIPLPQSPLKDTPRIVITPSHRESSMPGGCDHTMDACVTCEMTGEPFSEKHNELATTLDRMPNNQQMYILEPVTVTNMPSSPLARSAATSHPTWIHKLCDCHCITCLEGFFSPCTLYGKTQYRLENAESGIDTNDLTKYSVCNLPCWLYGVVHVTTLGCCGLLKVMQHSEVRENYNIEGDLTKDFCKGCCCGSCTLMQADREVRTRGKHPLPQEPRGAFSLWNNSKYDQGRRPSQPGLKPQMVYAPSQGVGSSHQEQTPPQGDNTYPSEKVPFQESPDYQQNKDVRGDCSECQNAEGSDSPSHKHENEQNTGIDPLSLGTSTFGSNSKDGNDNRRKLQKKYTKPSSTVPDEESVKTGQDVESNDSVIRRDRTMSPGNLKQNARNNGDEKPTEFEVNTRDNDSPPARSSPSQFSLTQEHSIVDREDPNQKNGFPLIGHSLNDFPSDMSVEDDKKAVLDPGSNVKNIAEQALLPSTPQHDLEGCDIIQNVPPTPTKRLSQHELDDCFGQRIFTKPSPPPTPEHNLADCDTNIIEHESEPKKTATVLEKAYHTHGLTECAPDEAVFIYYGDGKPQKHTIQECVVRKSESGADYAVFVPSGSSTPMTVSAAREHSFSQDEGKDTIINTVEENLRPSVSHVRSEILPQPKQRKSVQNLLSGLGWKQSSAPLAESTTPLDTRGDSAYESSSIFTDVMYARSNGSIQDVGTNSLPGRSIGAENKEDWDVGRGSSTMRDKAGAAGSQDKGWGSKWRYGKKAKTLGPAFWDGESEP